MTQTRCENLVGHRFARLLVVARAENSKSRQSRWVCACDCGGHTTVEGRSLRSGRIASCGCLRRELASRPRRFEALVGRRFGRLTVISCSGDSKQGELPASVARDRTWRCRCDCGTEKTILGKCLLYVGTLSCGCWQSKVAQANAGEASACFRHGHSGRGRNRRLAPPTPEYCAWLSARNRCHNPSNPAWPRYGGLGVEVCQRWDDFERFLTDMGPRPTPYHVLDRYDPSGDYEPGNARWASRQEQARNRRA
jgi:hypothetical protein